MDDHIDNAFGGLELDADSSGDEVPVLTSREARIKAAVERSKTTYTPDQAYTEPGHYVPMSSPVDGSAAYARHAEYLATQLYFAKEYAACLDLCRTIFKAGGADRESVDLALRSALHIGREAEVLDLVDESRQWWKGTPSLANTAAEIYRRTDRLEDALTACLLCINERGLSTAPLREAEAILSAWRGRKQISQGLDEALHLLAEACSYARASPAFRTEGGGDEAAVALSTPTAEVLVAAAEDLMPGHTEGPQLLIGLFRKVNGLSRPGMDDVPDRSVKTL